MHQAFSRLRGFGLIAALAVLAGCGTTATSGLDRNGVIPRMEQLPPPVPTNYGTPEFRLGPYDHIVVEVLAAPELRRDGRIDGAGNFNFPLVGSIPAAGLSPDALAARIADGLRGRFVRNPQVSVSVAQVVSQVVTVDGAVRLPGRFPVPGRMTLQDAIASAQGLTEDARVSEVVVFRTVDGRQTAALFSLKDIREGRYPDPAIYSQDVVVVGASRARRLFRDLAQVAPVFGVFTPLIYFFNAN